MAQRNLYEAEMERDRMIWDKRNSDWGAMYDTDSEPESQKTELHHANQWACQAQIHFDQSFLFLSLHQDCHASSRLESLHQLFQIRDFLGIERENLAAAAIQVVGCQEVRKDL